MKWQPSAMGRPRARLINGTPIGGLHEVCMSRPRRKTTSLRHACNAF